MQSLSSWLTVWQLKLLLEIRESAKTTKWSKLMLLCDRHFIYYS